MTTKEELQRLKNEQHKEIEMQEQKPATKNQEPVAKLKAQGEDSRLGDEEKKKQQIAEAQANQLKKNKFVMESDTESDSILADYKTRYAQESWYKEPKTVDGRTEFTFPGPEDACQFFQAQAEKNRTFVICDAETNHVVAYSNGDGIMRHADGKEFEKGDRFEPSKTAFKDFTMPSAAAKPSMR